MSRSQHWLRRLALPALLAVLGTAAHAQNTTTTTTTTTTTDTSMTPMMPMMPMMDASGMLMPSMEMTGPVDYRVLYNSPYDYIDLKLADTLGYSRSQIASIAKIARLTGLPFKYILNQVHQGRTFPWLASDYGLKLGDVLDASDEQIRIDQYLRAYNALTTIGVVQSSMISTAQTAISGPTLAELESRYAALNAAFPALPPTNIETSQIGSDTTTIAQASPPIAAPPPPPEPAPVEAVPSTVTHTETIINTVTVHHHRHHRRHRAHRHHRAMHKVRMGS